MGASRDRLHLAGTQSGADLRIVVAGELELATVPDLRAAVDELARPGMRLALDLDDLTYLDLAGVYALIALESRSREDGWELVLTGVTPRVYDVAQLCGLDGALVFRRASTALVAETGHGRFASLALYDDATPFSFTNGPEAAGLDEALAWARRRADRVTVRLGDRRYSAGVAPVAGLPALGGADARLAGPEQVPAAARPWRISAGTVWHAGDPGPVAAALGSALTGDRALADVRATADGSSLRVTFAVPAPTASHATERAGESLRGAWRRTGVDALPGEHFDLSFIDADPR